MKELNLTSMKATNPLGYLAALGAQAVFADSDAMPNLHWTNDAFSHAVITETTEQEIVNQAMYQLTLLRKSVALNAPKDDLKMSADEMVFPDCSAILNHIKIKMPIERDNIGIEIPFKGGENSNRTAH